MAFHATSFSLLTCIHFSVLQFGKESYIVCRLPAMMCPSRFQTYTFWTSVYYLALLYAQTWNIFLGCITSHHSSLQNNSFNTNEMIQNIHSKYITILQFKIKPIINRCLVMHAFNFHLVTFLLYVIFLQNKFIALFRQC